MEVTHLRAYGGALAEIPTKGQRPISGTRQPRTGGGAHNHGITTVAEPGGMTCHAMSGGATYPYRTAPPGR